MNDQMKIPREVAIELLTEPKAQLSNRMRKNCFASLEKIVEPDGAACYNSGRSPLASRNMAQLAKWHRRARTKIFRALTIQTELSGSPSENKTKLELVDGLLANWTKVAVTLWTEIQSRIKTV